MPDKLYLPVLKCQYRSVRHQYFKKKQRIGAKLKAYVLKQTSNPVISQILLHGCIEGGDSILTSAKIQITQRK